MRFYGFLSNGLTAALVDPVGSIDWLPWPRFDSPSVFTRLLGGDDAGYFRIVPEAGCEASQAYVDGTNILRTTLRADAGRIEVVDFLAIGRPELRRQIDAGMPFSVHLAPRFGYGLIAPAVEVQERGALFSDPIGPEALLFTVAGRDAGSSVAQDPLAGVWSFPAGRYELILRYVGDARRDLGETLDSIAAEVAEARRDAGADDERGAYRRNVRYWRDGLPQGYEGPYREAVRRGLLVLKGLTYRTTGALIAAPTTSLPEVPGGERQWDYRFSWIRDGAYAAEALLAAGDPVAARRFIEFMLECVDLQGKPFQAPFFHVDGTLIRGERELPWLRGREDSRPCREGNAATGQLQLDVEGDFLWLVYRYLQETQDRTSLAAWWDPLRALIDWVRSNWRLKDASLWEFRGRDADYTHSKLMCWVALNYGAELAKMRRDSTRATSWRAAAEEVRQAIEDSGYSDRLGHYVQAFGGEELDAALLMMPLYGYVDARAPRFEGTLRAIEERLVRGHWVYRYAKDKFGRAAYPFVLSTSHLARVHLRRGERDRAEELLRGLIDSATDLGLLAEHFDPETGIPRGNFPQAFSHLGVVLTAIELASPDSAGPEQPSAGAPR